MPLYNNPYNGNLKPRTRELRKNMTPHERKLWYCYLRHYPVKIHRQHMIDSFIVDFYCAAAKLIIELDGSQHNTRQGAAYDRDRSMILIHYGLDVIRFTNHDIDLHFTSVCEQINQAIQSRIEACHPNDQLNRWK